LDFLTTVGSGQQLCLLSLMEPFYFAHCQSQQKELREALRMAVGRAGHSSPAGLLLHVSERQVG
jgi:hypothetical protein